MGKSIGPEQKIERRKISSLRAYSGNSRTHSDAQIDQIAASIRQWGWTTPVLIDASGMIIAGHGRVQAADRLGISEIPVMVAAGWSEAQLRAYVIADNKIAENASWDADLLKSEFFDIAALGFDLELTGFNIDEINTFLAEQTAGQTDPDDLPDLPPDPVSRPGDVWKMGRHRLVCGDSTDADTVARALDGVQPHLMVTDPPYGVDYDPDWRNRANRANGKPYGAGAVGTVQNDDRADWREAWALFPGDVAYVWHAGVFSPTVADSLEVCGFKMRALIVWAKQRLVIGRGDYHHMHEPCWYAVKKGGTGHWAGDRKQTTLWQIEHRKSDTGHSTQKPVECMARPIRNNSSPGQAVYEPFSGSGTTIIACEMEGRACCAIELSPAYVDMAVMRWQAFTGQAAFRENDGSRFDEASPAERTS